MNMKKVWKVRNIKLWNSALHITRSKCFRNNGLLVLSNNISVTTSDCCYRFLVRIERNLMLSNDNLQVQCVLCIRASIRHFFSGHAESCWQHSFEFTTVNIPNDRQIHVQITLIVFIIHVLFKIKLYKNCIYCLFIAFLKGL